MKNIKIAVAQMNPIYSKKERNKKTIESFIDKASTEGCNIILLPELCNTGYMIKKEDLSFLGETTNGDFISFLCKLCVQKNIYIIAGYLETNVEKNEFFNSAIFIDNKGNILYNYRKNFLWKKEKILFSEGEIPKVIDCELGKIGILICYDMEFPEPSRHLGLQGAEIVFVPSCFSKIAETRWDYCINSNALFNLFYVIASNTVDEYCCGKSKIVSPNGQTIVQASRVEEDLIIETIDLESINNVREQIPYYQDFKVIYN